MVVDLRVAGGGAIIGVLREHDVFTTFSRTTFTREASSECIRAHLHELLRAVS